MSSFLEIPSGWLYSIPAAWFLAYIPSFRKTGVLARSKALNNLAPRTNVAKFGSKEDVDAKLKEKAARLEAAHYNGVESFPLWASAVLVAKFVGVENKTINLAATVYLGSRVVYNYIYVHQKTRLHATLRTLVWAASVAASFSLFYQAAHLVKN